MTSPTIPENDAHSLQNGDIVMLDDRMFRVRGPFAFDGIVPVMRDGVPVFARLSLEPWTDSVGWSYTQRHFRNLPVARVGRIPPAEAPI